VSFDLEDTTIHSYPYAFINKKGEAIVVTTLDAKQCQRLIDMYLAYQPRNSFHGLPPITDEACVAWARHMIDTGVNLIARSFGEGIVGHNVLFPINERVCEMLVVVSPQFQNIGIGTELVRCSIQLSHELGFEKIQLSVESTNVRARHVYKKCGFEYLSKERGSEVDMAIDLKRYRDRLNVSVAEVMNRDVISIHWDESCRAALEIFLNSHVAALPVIDNNEELIGIISKSDLMVPSQIGKKVTDVLTRDVLTVREGCVVARVIRLLQSKKVRSIPVVGRNKKLVGIIGRKDILAYYAKHV